MNHTREWVKLLQTQRWKAIHLDFSERALWEWVHGVQFANNFTVNSTKDLCENWKKFSFTIPPERWDLLLGFAELRMGFRERRPHGLEDSPSLHLQRFFRYMVGDHSRWVLSQFLRDEDKLRVKYGRVSNPHTAQPFDVMICVMPFMDQRCDLDLSLHFFGGTKNHVDYILSSCSLPFAWSRFAAQSILLVGDPCFHLFDDMVWFENIPFFRAWFLLDIETYMLCHWWKVVDIINRASRRLRYVPIAFAGWHEALRKGVERHENMSTQVRMQLLEYANRIECVPPPFFGSSDSMFPQSASHNQRRAWFLKHVHYRDRFGILMFLLAHEVSPICPVFSHDLMHNIVTEWCSLVRLKTTESTIHL